MVSAKRIAQLAKKWQRMAFLRRKQLTSMMATNEDKVCSMPAVASKGHCVVYTTDNRRFEVPLAYLGSMIFGELLRISQEEFGFVGDDGRLMVPCNATMLEYVMCLLRRNASAEVEKAFLSSMAMPCHYTSCVASSLGVNLQLSVWTS